MTQRDEVNISVIKSRFDNTKAPKNVYDKLTEIAKVVNSTPENLENQLRQMVHEPDYISFHTTDDMYRAALPFLIDEYKYKIKNFTTKNIQFYAIEKSSIKRFDTFRNEFSDHPADLAKIKEREERNKERITAGKKPREYKPMKIRKIPTGEKKKVTVTSISVFGIFNRYGLFQREDVGKIFGDNFKTGFAELILEDEECRLVQDLKCGKTYTFKCSIYFKQNHYELLLDEDGIPIEVHEDQPTIKDMLYRLSEPIGISNITEKSVGSYKVVHGIVKSNRTSVNKKDEMQGNLVLTSLDNNISFKTVWWNNPLFATQYPEETDVYVICDIRSSEKFGITGIGHFIIPINKPVKASIKKEVNINDWW